MVVVPGRRRVVFLFGRSRTAPFPLSIVPQHGRSFVFKVLVKELSIRSIIFRWRYPFPWYNAWESYANASGAIEPARGGAAGELFAEVRGEVVAVLGEEVVGGALEFLGRLCQLAFYCGDAHWGRVAYLLYNGLELLCGSKGEAVEDGLLEGAAWRFLAGLCPVDARQVPPVVAAIGIFFIANDDARVEQRAANGPEDGRDFAWGKQVVDVDDDLGALERQCAAVVARAFASRLGAGRRGRHSGRVCATWWSSGARSWGGIGMRAPISKGRMSQRIEQETEARREMSGEGRKGGTGTSPGGGGC